MKQSEKLEKQFKNLERIEFTETVTDFLLAPVRNHMKKKISKTELELYKECFTSCGYRTEEPLTIVELKKKSNEEYKKALRFVEYFLAIKNVCDKDNDNNEVFLNVEIHGLFKYPLAKYFLENSYRKADIKEYIANNHVKDLTGYYLCEFFAYTGEFVKIPKMDVYLTKDQLKNLSELLNDKDLCDFKFIDTSMKDCYKFSTDKTKQRKSSNCA